MVKQTEITIPLLIAHGYYPDDENERFNSLGLADPEGNLTQHYGGNSNLSVFFNNDFDEWIVHIDGQAWRRLLSWEQFQSLHMGVTGTALLPITPKSPRYLSVAKKLAEWWNKHNGFNKTIEFTIKKTDTDGGN